MTLLPHPVLVIDLETTGLQPGRHWPIELAAVVVEPDGSIGDHICHKVKPLDIELAEPKALRINRYSPEAWHRAIPLDEAMSLLLVFIRRQFGWNGFRWCAQYAPFDQAMLVASRDRTACHELEIAPLRHWIDTRQGLLWHRLAHGQPGGHGLKDLAEWAEVWTAAQEQAEHHGALADALATARSLPLLLQAMRTGCWKAGGLS